MSKNPNFFENISDNKMTESVKLQGGSDHQGRSAEQFLKYANNKTEQFQGYDQKQLNQNIGAQLGNNARQIKTQYSQISHVENGFKKLKGNQVQILKELRNQFDILRNQQTHGQKKEKPKSISSSSNQRASNRDQSSQSSSISSSKQYKKEKDSNRDHAVGVNNREQRLWVIERKQYEMIVANCQQKIQELLHAELEYKKIIHNLKSNIANQPKISVTVEQTKIQSQLVSIKSKLSSQEAKYRNIERQLEKTRNQNKMLQEKIISYEGMLIGKDHDFSKYEDQIRRLEDTLRLQKQKFHNIEIEKVKMIMEYQILEKQKSQEILRLNKIIQQNNRHFEQNKRISIQRLEDLVELKDQRYRLLLIEYQRLRRDVHEREEIVPENNSNQIEAFLAIMQQYITQKNQTQSRDIQRLIAAIRQMRNNQQSNFIPEREDGEYDRLKLLMEIRTLKDQIQKLKDLHHEDLDKFRQIIGRQFQGQIYGLKQTIRTLQQKLKQKTDYTPSGGNQYKPINSQVFNLKRQISELQNLLREKDSLLNQMDENWKKYKAKWQRGEEQIRNLKNNLDSVQFQNQKLMKQLDFRINILKRQNQAAIRSITSELESQRRNVVHWRNQFENVKKFYEAKIVEKNRLIATLQNTTEITEIKKQYDLMIESAKQQYQRQIAALAQKLSLLAQNQKELEDFRKRYNYLENCMYDLKLNYQRNRQLNDGVDHLWGMKEVQYRNINTIVHQVKQNFIVNSNLRNNSKNNIQGGIIGGIDQLFSPKNNIQGNISDGFDNLFTKTGPEYGQQGWASPSYQNSSQAYNQERSINRAGSANNLGGSGVGYQNAGQSGVRNTSYRESQMDNNLGYRSNANYRDSQMDNNVSYRDSQMRNNASYRDSQTANNLSYRDSQARTNKQSSNFLLPPPPPPMF